MVKTHFSVPSCGDLQSVTGLSLPVKGKAGVEEDSERTCEWHETTTPVLYCCSLSFLFFSSSFFLFFPFFSNYLKRLKIFLQCWNC